jgi:hypothetical protein
VGGGGEGGIIHYTIIQFNMADLTFLRNTRCDGFSLMATASFQDLGNVNNGNLFVVA